MITGGPTDKAMCEYLHHALSVHGEPGSVRYTQLSIEEFAAVPGYCEVVVTGDSFGFHLALAHQRPCVLLLGPSNGAEVIPKHATTVAALRSTFACSPCAHQVACGGVGGCMDTIHPDQALEEVEKSLSQNNVCSP
ncbi:MAG: glycosyltransferase family 9 protein [Longimicrobiales bacterium]